MKKNKITLSFICLFLSSSILAEILECRSFTPLPGRDMQMLETLNMVADWHESHGAVAGIYPIRIGGQGNQTNYCLRWDDAAAWAKTADATYDEVWKKAKKGSKKKAEASMTLLSSRTYVNIDATVKADDGFTGRQVWHAFSVLPAEGRDQDVVNRLSKMAEFVEKAGNRVEIYTDGPGGNGSVYFLTIADSWSEFQKSWSKTSEIEGWQEFVAATDPSMYSGKTAETEFNGVSIR